MNEGVAIFFNEIIDENFPKDSNKFSLRKLNTKSISSIETLISTSETFDPILLLAILLRLLPLPPSPGRLLNFTIESS